MPDPHAHDVFDAMPTDVVTTGAATAIDPVCGMTTTVKPDGRKEECGRATFHFCSDNCKTKLGLDP